MKTKPNLDIETISGCNRFCSTCLRNSHPDKVATSSWFNEIYLHEQVIFDAAREADNLGFFNEICLSYYNEPLLDNRLAMIIYTLKDYISLPIYFHSNGDLLDEPTAKMFDGFVDRIVFTLYMMDESKKSERVEWLESLFRKTEISVITESQHIPTHFSPAYPVTLLADENKNRPCLEPTMRVIIGHDGKFRMCCDDLLGEFDLGTFPEKSIGEHWEEKQEYIKRLSQVGGRNNYSYCISCPRP